MEPVVLFDLQTLKIASVKILLPKKVDLSDSDSDLDADLDSTDSELSNFLVISTCHKAKSTLKAFRSARKQRSGEMSFIICRVTFEHRSLRDGSNQQTNLKFQEFKD